MAKSERWLAARARSAKLLEARSRTLRVAKVYEWEKQVPDILHEYVPVLTVVKKLIAQGLGEGKSERTLIRWVQDARNQYADMEKSFEVQDSILKEV